MFKKKENQEKKKKKQKVVHITPRKNRKVFLVVGWGLLIFSVVFGVWNNFRSERIVTINETKVIQEKESDISGITNFVTDFAKTYYSFDTNGDSQKARSANLEKYLSNELLKTNTDNLKEVKGKVSVSNVKVYSVKPIAETEYEVMFTVQQQVQDKHVENAYTLDVYVKDNAYSIIKNPTFVAMPKKSDYERKRDTSTDSVPDYNKVKEFLETFFKIYPQSTKKELVYYVKDENVQEIQKNYEFVEISNLIVKENDGYQAHFYVTYKNTDTQMLVVNEYDIQLSKQNDKYVIEELE
ncbi:conjugal transfer protein [Isobaculum melis]|uniref:Conjugative transposon protein TcpC n=1 Tax=Isobaculum melis TaxID=142588 RepID=A0A1H9TQ92_9LACT|nr:conjugal transfer protein [Isobaculum melis]SER99174.1 Conjugative transposon protein TcpC [Isobaculum melis]